MSFMGKSRIVNIPIFTTESETECAKVVSFTYDKHSLYFEPQGRILEYFTYMRSGYELDITKFEKNNLIKALFIKGLYTSTIKYRSILADSSICIHHGIENRHVGLIEIITIDLRFSIAFLTGKMSIPFLRRLLICVLVHLKAVTFLLKK